MPVKELLRVSDGDGGELVVTVQYSAMGSNAKAIDYYESATAVNTSARDAVLTVVRRNNEQEVARRTVPAGTTIIEEIGRGLNPNQRRTFDLRHEL